MRTYPIMFIFLLFCSAFSYIQPVEDSTETMDVQITNATVLDTTTDSMAFFKNGNLSIVPLDTFFSILRVGKADTLIIPADTTFLTFADSTDSILKITNIIYDQTNGDAYFKRTIHLLNQDAPDTLDTLCWIENGELKKASMCDALFPPQLHYHTLDFVIGILDSLASKSDTGHTHGSSDVTIPSDSTVLVFVDSVGDTLVPSQIEYDRLTHDVWFPHYIFSPDDGNIFDIVKWGTDKSMWFSVGGYGNPDSGAYIGLRGADNTYLKNSVTIASGYDSGFIWMETLNSVRIVPHIYSLDSSFTIAASTEPGCIWEIDGGLFGVKYGGSGTAFLKIKDDSVQVKGGTLYVGQDTNSVQINDTTGILLKGTATQWSSITFGIYIGLPGVSTPTKTTYATVFDGYAYGVGDNSTLQPVEVPYNFDESSDSVYFQIHAVTGETDVDDRTVAGRLYFSFCASGDTVSENLDSIDFEGTISANTATNVDFDIDMGGVSVSGYGISVDDVIHAKIKRIASSGTEPSDDPIFATIDMNYEANKIGAIDKP